MHHQLRDAVRDGAGLAGARAGDDQQRARTPTLLTGGLAIGRRPSSVAR